MNNTDISTDSQQIENLLASIEACEAYLAAAAKPRHELGPFGWGMTPESVTFAEAQLAHDRQLLEDLQAPQVTTAAA